MGKIFESKGLRLFGSIMTIVLVIVWVGVFVTMLHCLRTRKLLWPRAIPEARDLPLRHDFLLSLFDHASSRLSF